MTPLIAARFQWVESFSRRLFAEVDVAAVPVAWAQLFQDPCARLESQLALVAGAPDAGEAAPANEPGFVQNPMSRVALPSRPRDRGRGSAAILSTTRPSSTRRDKPGMFPYVAPPTTPFITPARREPAPAPEEQLHSPQAAAPLNSTPMDGAIAYLRPNQVAEDAQARTTTMDAAFAYLRPSVGAEDAADITAHRSAPRDIVTDGFRSAEREVPEESRSNRVNKDPARRVAASVHNIRPTASTPAPAPEFSSDTLPGPTRLVRGAGGLAGLLRANAPFIPGNPRPSSGITPAPVASESGAFTDGAHRTGVSGNVGSDEPSRVPSATGPTVDEVLAELYDRLHLEYLRAYGASGD